MKTHLISYVQSGLSLTDEITQIFSPLNIYIPWGGTAPLYNDNEKINTLYPPEELKPAAEIDMLLNECFNWAYEQGEKSRKEIIKTGRINPTSNESLRRIRSILASRTAADTSEKDMIIRWHMLLHLANRLDENRKEANMMLEGLKKKPSPLLNNADLTEKTKYPLENLTGIDADLLLSDKSTRQLLTAWYGLFNTYIEKGDLLLTVDRHIFEHLLQEGDLLYSSNSLRPQAIISFKIPVLKSPGNRDAESENKITVGDDIGNIAGSDKKYEDKISALSELAEKPGKSGQLKPGDSHILISLLYFPPLDRSGDVEVNIYKSLLPDRALMLAEIDE